MKASLFSCAVLLGSLLLSVTTFAEQAAEQWQSSVLTEATIKKVQTAKNDYKKCVAEQMKKPAYLEQDSRKATEEIIKLCEPVLSKMRDVYLAEKVPGEIADRHLRQIRIQVTRTVLQELLFAQAAKAGQP
jgi:hypothetical protein